MKNRSNRTFMELKYENDKKNLMGVVCSNRTFMELKFSESSPVPRKYREF